MLHVRGDFFEQRGSVFRALRLTLAGREVYLLPDHASPRRPEGEVQGTRLVVKQVHVQLEPHRCTPHLKCESVPEFVYSV